MPQRALTAYVLAGVVLFAYAAHCCAIDYVVDDSFITFRYVANFIRGLGIVYNPGERVEGYTNFLWLMLLSGVAWISPGADLLRTAQVLGVACGAATICVAIAFSWHVHRSASTFGVLAGALLACSSSFCAWSTGGLETTLFALLVFAASCSYVRALEHASVPAPAALLFGLAALTRPEGVFLFAVVSGHLVWSEYRATGTVLSTRLLRWGLVFTIIFGPYYVWRCLYYGYPFPNTFYAKVGTGLSQYVRGARYLVNYALSTAPFLVAFPFVAFFSAKRSTAVTVFALEATAYQSYIVFVGGDGLAHYRFVACIAPFVFFLMQEGLRVTYEMLIRLHATPRAARLASAACAAVVAVALLCNARPTLGVWLYPSAVRWYEPQSELSFPGDGTEHSYRWFDNYFVDRLAVAARWLQANAAPTAVVAATPAGSIAYHMQLPVIDMLGLNDLHIAHVRNETFGTGRAGHEKGDGKYVLSRSPEYILLGNVAVLPRPLSDADMAKKLVQRSEREIWADPQFHARYERVTVRLNDTGPFQYFTFYRNKGATGLGG